MIRTSSAWIWGILLVGLHFVCEVEADDALPPSPGAPSSVAPPLTTPAGEPPIAKPDESPPPVEEGNRPAPPVWNSPEGRPDQPTPSPMPPAPPEVHEANWLTPFDDELLDLALFGGAAPPEMPTQLAQGLASAPGQNNTLTLNHLNPLNAVPLGAVADEAGLALPPGFQAPSDPQASKIGLTPSQDPKPAPAAQPPAAPANGGYPLPPIPVRSAPGSGQNSWATVVDGKPLDLGGGGPPLRPGMPGFGRSETIGRFGWWGGGYNGSPTKVGEYQGLSQSPFWDIDTLRSNGKGSVDLWGSQLNSEAWDFRSRLYQNGFGANINFEQFPHQLGHELLAGGSRQSSTQVVSEDLNLGADYAIRVQQMKAAFQGPLINNVTWKFNVWTFRKFGDRQANAMAHCFNMNLVGGGAADNRCHVVSQQQRINWLTVEIEPGLVAKFDKLTVDYTRTMRSFSASDQTVLSPYNRFGAFGGNGTFATVYPYAIVPDSMFQMDRLKLGWDITKTLRLYSYLYNGDMQNLSRNTHNQFGGFDLRLIDTTLSGVTATLYAKMNENRNQLPPTLLPEEKVDPSVIEHPVNYTRLWTGLDGQWFPFQKVSTFWQGLSFRAGYEYHEISREYANYPTDIPSGYVVPPTLTNSVITGPYFNQPTTRTNQFVLAQRMKWTSGVTTFARYQLRFTENPLYGLQINSGSLNSAIPTEDQIFEFGGAWAPRTNLLFSLRAEIQSTLHKSDYTHFTESNYPVVFTAWYAPTPKLSISGGYSYFSNWVNQDVTLGYRGLDEPPPAETLRFGSKGQTQVIDVGGRYAMSDKLVLTAGIFFTDGLNVFNAPSGAQTGANWSNMPAYANVLAQSIRYQAGFDYTFTKTVGCYFRANIFDYLDKSQEINTGNSYFFMAGLSATF